MVFVNCCKKFVNCCRKGEQKKKDTSSSHAKSWGRRRGLSSVELRGSGNQGEKVFFQEVHHEKETGVVLWSGREQLFSVWSEEVGRVFKEAKNGNLESVVELNDKRVWLQVDLQKRREERSSTELKGRLGRLQLSTELKCATVPYKGNHLYD